MDSTSTIPGAGWEGLEYRDRHTQYAKGGEKIEAIKESFARL